MAFLLRCFAILFISLHVYAAPIIIGTLAFSPPFEMVANKKGDLVGFEVDLMNEICRRIQVTCQYKTLFFKQIFNQVQSGGVDLGVAAITITEERELLFSFSLPYMLAQGQLLTTAKSSINSMSDVDGKWIGVEAGSLFKSIAAKKFNKAKIVEYNTQQDLFQAVMNEDVDVIMFDLASAQYWINSNAGSFKAVGSGFSLGAGYGVVANMDHAPLITQINKALLEMESDGTYLMIYKRYFYI